MGHYFFLGSVLPPLKTGSKPDLTFEELMELFRDNMSRKDLKKVSLLRLYIDLKNVRQLLMKQPLDPRGNLSEKELDEALLNRESLPEYLFEYFDKYETEAEQIRNYSEVFIQFFKEMEKKEKGFLKFYFNFEREWRLILAGYRAKKLGVDPTVELQHEDATEPLVAQILAQKDAPFFEFPFGFEELDEKLKGIQKSPKEQYETMAAFRFHRILDKTQDHPFSVDFALGYFACQMIVEDWNALNEKQGNQSLTEITR